MMTMKIGNMKVKHLIEILSEQDPERLVIISNSDNDTYSPVHHCWVGVYTGDEVHHEAMLDRYQKDCGTVEPAFCLVSRF